jgi:hypothetical protein
MPIRSLIHNYKSEYKNLFWFDLAGVRCSNEELMKENVYVADKASDLSNTLQAKPKENKTQKMLL